MEKRIKNETALVVAAPGEVTAPKKQRAPKTAFQPGHVKKGGRKPGTLNKRTRFAHEVAERMGVDPAGYLLHIIKSDVVQLAARDPKTGEAIMEADGLTPKLVWHAVTLADRIDAAKTLMRYMYPALQAVELTGKDGGPMEAAVLDVTEILANPELAKAAQTMALMMANQAADADADANTTALLKRAG